MAKPDQPSAAYTSMADDWRLIRDVRAGSSAIRQAGQTYLPKFEGEGDKAFDIRLKHAPFTAHYEDATRSIIAKPFSKEVRLQGRGENKDDVPENAKAWAEDINLEGDNLHVFANALFEEAVHLGGVYILADYPRDDAPVATLRDQKERGLRPFAKIIAVDDVLAVHDTMVGGVRRVTSFRYQETEMVVADFEETIVSRVRHLTDDLAGNVELTTYEKSEDEWVVIDDLSGPINIGQIPLVPVILGKGEERYAPRPTMLQVAHKQIEHYQHANRITNNFNLQGFSILQAKGMDKPVDENGDDVIVALGPGSIVFTGKSHGDAKPAELSYVAPDASVVTGMLDWERQLVEQIRHLALQPALPQQGMQNTAATTSAINATRAHSVLQAWAFQLKDALEQMFVLMHLWNGAPSEVEVYVNTDFATEMLFDSDPKELREALMMGYITLPTYFDELMRRGILGPQFDKAKEIEQLEEDGVLVEGASLIEAA